MEREDEGVESRDVVDEDDEAAATGHQRVAKADQELAAVSRPDLTPVERVDDVPPSREPERVTTDTDPSEWPLTGDTVLTRRADPLLPPHQHHRHRRRQGRDRRPAVRTAAAAGAAPRQG